MTGDDDKTSGIKTVSVGFGSAPSSARQAIRPAPPYRVLIAGDFGLSEGDGSLPVAGRDLAELLADTRPRVAVTAANVLGSFPATVSETVELTALGDLRPRTLIGQLGHHSRAAEAAGSGNERFLAEAGQLYDRLVAKLPGQQGGTASTSASSTDEAGGDGLDSLFGMIAMESRKPDPGDSPADRVSAFIFENIAPNRSTAAPSMGSAAEALLDAQALAFLSDDRLRQVLENWYGLRLLLEARSRAVEITLLQVTVGTESETLLQRLAGSDGALQEDLFDILVLANRCSAMSAGAEMLKAVAEAADAFDTIALASLEADFALLPADRLAAMDAPQHAVDAAGFEVFKALRARDHANRLGLFWNDALAVEASSLNPELYIPAAWIAAALVLRNVAQTGWPGLRASAGDELGGFAVTAKTLGGREVATATRVQATDESAAGLAGFGISTLNGRIDRDSVHFARAPLFSAKGVAAKETINDHLVLARINQLLQAELPAVLNSDASAQAKADSLGARFDALAEAFAVSPVFTVTTAKGQDGEALLDISVRLPQGVADRGRFGFQIPC